MRDGETQREILKMRKRKLERRNKEIKIVKEIKTGWGLTIAIYNLTPQATKKSFKTQLPAIQEKWEARAYFEERDVSFPGNNDVIFLSSRVAFGASTFTSIAIEANGLMQVKLLLLKIM
jgi:hypothetical protein